MVSHKDFSLGEAWARALTGDQAGLPERALRAPLARRRANLQKRCPEHVAHQCWNVQDEAFEADGSHRRVPKHRLRSKRGIEVLEVRSSLVLRNG